MVKRAAIYMNWLSEIYKKLALAPKYRGFLQISSKPIRYTYQVPVLMSRLRLLSSVDVYLIPSFLVDFLQKGYSTYSTIIYAGVSKP
jgi:polysaccharide pyruvyl transferase WcaK-like protein